GGGVYGGRAGALPVWWLWEGERTGYGTQPEFWPVTLQDPMYQKATPMLGIIDPVTNQVDPNGEHVHIPHVTRRSVGAVVRHLTSGGDGWGDPFERDPERVKTD